MTYQEFKNKYNGQYVDVDSYPKEWPYQCFDLAQLYAREVINVPDYVFAGCKVVKNLIYDPVERAQMDEYFDEIDTHTMQQGDISIWGNGDAGHIAIYDHYENGQCYYFSQNPNPCEVMIINLPDHHAFRRKQVTPPAPPNPTPVITPNVERDEYKNQIEVLNGADKLRVRDNPSLNGETIGYANAGFYNYLETKEADGYVWYRISDSNWIAYSDEWAKLYPAKKDEYKQFKILDKKDGQVLIDLGKVWINE